MTSSFIRKGLWVSFFFFTIWTARACDVCGCSVFNQNLGILPQFNHHFVGMRYSYRGFRSEHPSVLFPTVSHEKFHTQELMGRFVIGDKWQILGFVPYNIHIKNEEGIVDMARGIGDAYFLGLYSVIQHKKSRNGKVYQNLQIGGGIKLPTGKYDFETQKYGWIPGIQMGSGTVDFLGVMTYIFRYQSWGAVAESGMKITTQNGEYEHKYGNAFNQSLRFLKVLEAGRWTLMPSAGIGFERWSADQLEGYETDLSGGYAMQATAGIDIVFSKFNIGINGHLPVHQNIGRGYITSQPRYNIQAIYFF